MGNILIASFFSYTVQSLYYSKALELPIEQNVV